MMRTMTTTMMLTVRSRLVITKANAGTTKAGCNSHMLHSSGLQPSPTRFVAATGAGSNPQNSLMVMCRNQTKTNNNKFIKTFQRRAGSGSSIGGNRNARVFKDTPAQTRARQSMLSHDLTVLVGPAGSGKTVIAMQAAMALLNSGHVDGIVVCRPTVSVKGSQDLGHLPGTLEDKLEPWVRPVVEAAGSNARTLRESGKLTLLSIGHARGLTIDHCFIIIDEAQNATPTELHALISRAGEGTRVAVIGDFDQIDLPKKYDSGLRTLVERIHANPSAITSCAMLELSFEDVMRSKLAKEISILFTTLP